MEKIIHFKANTTTLIDIVWGRCRNVAYFTQALRVVGNNTITVSTQVVKMDSSDSKDRLVYQGLSNHSQP